MNREKLLRLAGRAAMATVRARRQLRRAFGRPVYSRLFNVELAWDPRTDLDIIWNSRIPVGPPRGTTYDIGAFADAVQLRALARLLYGNSGIRTILDIGAYHGGYAIFAAKCASAKDVRVFAVEPDPWNFMVLQSNVAINELAQSIRCINAAVLGTSGEARVVGTGMSSRVVSPGACKVEGGSDARALAYADLLSEVGTSNIDLCIMDVEGAEEEILVEMDRMDSVPRDMFVELHPFAWRHPENFLIFLREMSARHRLQWTDAYLRNLDEFAVSDFYIGPCRVKKLSR